MSKPVWLTIAEKLVETALRDARRAATKARLEDQAKALYALEARARLVIPAEPANGLARRDGLRPRVVLSASQQKPRSARHSSLQGVSS